MNVRYLTFRQKIGLSDAEAVNLKSLLLKLGVLTIFRPLSEKFSGMSLKSPGGERFMLINCNQPRCRQHFTIAHELYHLFIEKIRFRIIVKPKKAKVNQNDVPMRLPSYF